MNSQVKQHYGGIDGLRTFACICIVMMHVRLNGTYNISEWMGYFNNFVFMFLVISSFGMCCGYYDNIINNKISMSEFYSRRFRKALPFFSVLVLIDFVISPSVGSLYEAFADITLLFGFLPDAGNIHVIGVGWFLGLIFVFYICFPFFCTLLTGKKKAWVAFGISLIYNHLCLYYFNVGRSNILYSACFFLAGGLIFLYKDDIVKFNRWVMLILAVVSFIIYIQLKSDTFSSILFSVVCVMYAMVSIVGILDNRVTHFFSGISMEVYLAHMFIYRVVEKAGLNYICGNGWISYIVAVIIVVAGTVVYAVVFKHCIKCIESIIINTKKRLVD